jgi:hypothetical protein
MALYLSYNIDTKEEKIITSSWSNTDIPILAVSTDANNIKFFQDEGVLLEQVLDTTSQVTAIDWHPTNNVLAYGYLDGIILII